jgi:hypothetical protein
MKIEQLIKAIRSLPCSDCGQTFLPIAMDLDHPPGAEKIAEVSRLMYQKAPFMEICAEVEKCDLVCSNCHRLRTEGRWHGRRKFLAPGMTVEVKVRNQLAFHPGGLTVAQMAALMGAKDDRRIRMALARPAFAVVTGTGTHHIRNPRRYILAVQ